MDANQFNGDDDRDVGCTEDFDTCECPACRDWRSNREPDEDGEAFRGGEAAAFAREQAADSQKLK